MIERTDAEIRAKVAELWPDVNLNETGWGNRDKYFDIERKSGYIDITVAQMYGKPGLSFPQLNALAQFFDTMNVETEEEFAGGGCETCEYGSKYGFTLRISPGSSFKELP